MLHNDVDATMARIREASARHAATLAGFQTIGYDTPGYGNGAHDGNGAPRFLKALGAFAEECDLPFLIDSASCLPVVGYSPADVNADVMAHSMDKPGRSPIAGLMIGKEEAMSYVRKALGLGGDRQGGVSSHGKAVFSASDPGRDSLVGLRAYLEVLKNDPGRVTRPIDQYHEVMVEAFAEMKPSRFRDRVIIRKSYHMGGLEVNYQQTWDDGSAAFRSSPSRISTPTPTPSCSRRRRWGWSPPPSTTATCCCHRVWGPCRPTASSTSSTRRWQRRHW